MSHRRLAVALTLALTCLSFTSLAAQDKPIELKFSSWVGIAHGHHTGVMVPWAKMIEEKSGGRLKVTIYPGSTLGKAADHVDLVTGGIADMGFASPGMTPGRFPLISVAELPLLFKSGKGGSMAVWSLADGLDGARVSPGGHDRVRRQLERQREPHEGLHRDEHPDDRARADDHPHHDLSRNRSLAPQHHEVTARRRLSAAERSQNISGHQGAVSLRKSASARASAPRRSSATRRDRPSCVQVSPPR